MASVLQAPRRKANPWVSVAAMTVAVLGVLAILAEPAQAATITATMGSTSAVAGATATYSFTFTPATAWPTSGKVQITFPSTAPRAFSFSATPVVTATGGGTCMGTSGATYTFTSVTTSSSTVTATRPGAAACPVGTAITVTVTNVKNGGASGSAGNVVLSTLDSVNSVVDTTSGNAITLTAAAFVTKTVQAQTYVVAERNNYWVNVTLVNPIPASGKFVVTWPSTMTLGRPATPMSVTVSGGGCTGTAATSSSTVTITIGAAPCSANAAMSFKFTNLENTGWVVSDTVNFKSQAGTSDIDTGSGTITTVAGAIAAMITGTSTTAGDPSTYTISFTVPHLWLPNGYLVVQVPSEYNIASVSASMSGCTTSTGFAATIFSQTITGNTLYVKLAGDCVAGSAAAFSLTGVNNPLVAGGQTWTLQTTTKNLELIDQGTKVVTIIPGTLTSASLNVANTTVRVATPYSFTFKPANPWQKDGSLTLKLPSTSLVSAPAATLVGCNGALTPIFYASNVTLRLVRTGTGRTDCTAKATVNVTGITNPRASGLLTVKLTTRSVDARDIDTVDRTYTAVPDKVLSAAIAPSDRVVAHVPTLVATVKLHNDWMSLGKLQFDFPSLYSLGTVTSSASTGCLGPYTATVIAQRAELTRTGAGECLAGTTFTVTFTGIKNAGVAGNYTVPVTVADTTGSAMEVGNAAFEVLSTTFTSSSITADALESGAMASYTVHLKLATAWPSDGRLQVDLPTAYPAPVSVSAVFGTGSCVTGSLSASVDARRVSVVRSGGVTCSAGNTVELTITGIRNRGVSGSSGVIGIRTQGNNGNPIDLGTGTVTLIPAALANPTLVASKASAGATTSYTLSFMPRNPIPGDGRFQLDLSSAFGIPGAITASSSPACNSGTYAGANTATTATALRSGGDPCIVGRLVSITFSGIRNPRTAGTYAVIVSSADSTGARIDQGTAILTITPGELEDTDAEAADAVVAHTSAYTFRLRAVNPWPGNGVIAIKLPEGVGLPMTPGLTASGCERLFGITTSGSTILLSPNGAVDGCMERMAFTITGFQNPTRSGTPNVHIETRSTTGAAIDSAEVPIRYDPGAAYALQPIQPLFVATVGQPATLMVNVVDGFGNPVGGTGVSWAMDKGEGKVLYPNTNSGGSGTATTTFQSDTKGDSVVTVSAGNLENSPLPIKVSTLAASGGGGGGGGGGRGPGVSVVNEPAKTTPPPPPPPVPGTGSAAGASKGDPAPPGSKLTAGPSASRGRAGQSVPLVVEVRDLDGKPLAGIGVSWTIIHGDGAVDPNAVTKSNGQATGSLQSLHPGTVTVRAQLSTGAMVEFTVTITPAALDHVRAERGTGNTILVHGYDAFGNEITDLGDRVTVDGVPCTGGRCEVADSMAHTVKISLDGHEATAEVSAIASAADAHKTVGAPGPGISLAAAILGLALVVRLGSRRR